MADVAQLVERRFVVPVVAGSIPVIRPIRQFIVTIKFSVKHGLNLAFNTFYLQAIKSIRTGCANYYNTLINIHCNKEIKVQKNLAEMIFHYCIACLINAGSL